MKLRMCALSVCLAAAASAVAAAGPGDTQKILGFYADRAKAADPAFDLRALAKR